MNKWEEFKKWFDPQKFNFHAISTALIAQKIKELDAVPSNDWNDVEFRRKKAYIISTGFDVIYIDKILKILDCEETLLDKCKSIVSKHHNKYPSNVEFWDAVLPELIELIKKETK